MNDNSERTIGTRKSFFFLFIKDYISLKNLVVLGQWSQHLKLWKCVRRQRFILAPLDRRIFRACHVCVGLSIYQAWLLNLHLVRRSEKDFHLRFLAQLVTIKAPSSSFSCISCHARNSWMYTECLWNIYILWPVFNSIHSQFLYSRLKFCLELSWTNQRVTLVS